MRPMIGPNNPHINLVFIFDAEMQFQGGVTGFKGHQEQMDDSPEKETNVARIPLDISAKLQRDSPEWCDTYESQKLVRRRVDSVQVDVVLLNRRHVDGIVGFTQWTV